MTISINRPSVTITGKTYEITNESWNVKYRRTFINRNLSLGVKKESANFMKVFNKEADAIEIGEITPRPIMRKYVDNKLFEVIEKVDENPNF